VIVAGRVCVVGSFMMDLIIRAPRRPLAGETVVGSSFATILGGKGFNQAVAAARAGATTAMVGRVGDDDYGRRFQEHLALEKINDDFVFVEELEGTGIGLPLVEDSGENSIVIIPRCNTRVSVDDVYAAGALIAGTDVLLLQFELPMDPIFEAARRAREGGAKVVVNPAPAPEDVKGALALRGLIDVLVPNVTEARQLAGKPHSTDPSELAGILRERFECDVVVTLGSRGALVLDDDHPVLVPTHTVPVIDTVGAGDAFCGALGTWIAYGATLREAVVFANAAGALAVGTAGAEPAMPRRIEILRLLEEGRRPLEEAAT
jgi:ribokinase